MHHVIPKSIGGTKVIPLCTICHGKVHGFKIGSSHLIKLGQLKAKQRGVKIGCPRKVDYSEVIRLRKLNYSLSEIAIRVGSTKSGISKILKNCIDLK